MRDLPDSRTCSLPFSAGEHLSSRERPSARRSLLTPVLAEGFSWQPDRVPWYGNSDTPLEVSMKIKRIVHESDEL